MMYWRKEAYGLLCLLLLMILLFAVVLYKAVASGSASHQQVDNIVSSHDSRVDDISKSMTKDNRIVFNDLILPPNMDGACKELRKSLAETHFSMSYLIDECSVNDAIKYYEINMYNYGYNGDEILHRRRNGSYLLSEKEYEEYYRAINGRMKETFYVKDNWEVFIIAKPYSAIDADNATKTTVLLWVIAYNKSYYKTNDKNDNEDQF